MLTAHLPALHRWRPDWQPVALIFFAAILLHLLLDRIGGVIGRLWPFSDDLYALVTVPPSRSHWVWSFVFHWTFLAELAIWLAAVILHLHHRRIGFGTTRQSGA